MADRALQAQIKRLEAALKFPENRECFDCGTRQPRWASTNLGVFICLRCAGIHRSLGTHISKVRSVTMDKWEEDMIVRCEKIGNKNGRVLYEARATASDYRRPTGNTDSVALENALRKKYESRAYFAPNFESIFDDFIAAAESTVPPREADSPLVMSHPVTPPASNEGATTSIIAPPPATSSSPAFVEWGNFMASSNKKHEFDDIFSTASTTGGSEAAVRSEDLFGQWRSNPASPFVPDVERAKGVFPAPPPQPFPTTTTGSSSQRNNGGASSDTTGDLLDMSALPARGAALSGGGTVDTQAILDAFDAPIRSTRGQVGSPPNLWASPTQQSSSSPSKRSNDGFMW